MPVDVRVAVLGDAHVLGVGDDDAGGWVARVLRRARARGVTVTGYPLGVRGETSPALRERWRDEVGRRLPDASLGRVVVSVGSADVLAGDRSGATAPRPGSRPAAGTTGPRPEQLRLRVDPTDSEQALAAVVAVARTRWPTVVVGPPPAADPAAQQRLRDLERRQRAVCGDLGVAYLRVLEPLLRHGAWVAEAVAGDGRHAGPGGHAALADLVDAWPAWQALLRRDPPDPAAGVSAR